MVKLVFTSRKALNNAGQTILNAVVDQRQTNVHGLATLVGVSDAYLYRIANGLRYGLPFVLGIVVELGGKVTVELNTEGPRHG